ncbi:Pr6Pr family membrane protein [Nonomuraea gerenzanensis]|nr:Pr6Pr family membrane protein [Nonomuraea gerenzanensis]UBU18953.1 Pr6Pr family membrane protein [Nonomuraea gerenzanensis]
MREGRLTAWRLLLVAATVTGLVCLTSSIGRPWAYFTVQSNVMLALYYGWRVAAGRRRPASAAVKGAVTLYLLVTCLVNYVSRDLENPLALLDGGGARGWGNFLLHYVTPLMAVTDWIAFDRGSRARWAAPFAWLGYPLLYGAFVLLAAPNLPRRYVYPFLNVERLGWPTVASVAAGVLAAFVVLGYALLGLRRLTTPKAGVGDARPAPHVPEVPRPRA